MIIRNQRMNEHINFIIKIHIYIEILHYLPYLSIQTSFLIESQIKTSLDILYSYHSKRHRYNMKQSCKLNRILVKKKKKRIKI